MDTIFATKEIDLYTQTLSLEGFNLKPSIKALKEFLPNFITSVTTFYSSFANANEELSLPLINESKLKKSLNNVDYTAVRKMLVIGPKGLKTTYVDYIGSVGAAVAHAEELMDKVLNPFANWVTLLLSTPENLKSAQNFPITPATSNKKLEGIRKGIEQRLDPRSNQQKFLYGKIVLRNKDWIEVIETTNDLSSRFIATKRKEIVRKVNDITESLNTLIQRIEEDPDTYQLSGVTVSSLAEQCYTVGKEIEHYSATGYLVQELHTAVQETVKQLESTF